MLLTLLIQRHDARLTAIFQNNPGKLVPECLRVVALQYCTLCDVSHVLMELISLQYKQFIIPFSLSLPRFNGHFPGDLGQPVFIEAKDDGDGGDNWTTGAISRATFIIPLLLVNCCTLHLPGGASPHQQTATVLLVLLTMECTAAYVRLITPTFPTWWTMLRINFSTRYRTMLVMFYHSFCLSTAMNLHTFRTRRHDRTLSQ